MLSVILLNRKAAILVPKDKKLSTKKVGLPFNARIAEVVESLIHEGVD